MKKQITTFSKYAILLVFLLGWGFAKAAPNPLWPNFNLELRNDVQVSDRIYEFDIYLVHTGDYITPVDFELSNIQMGIFYNANILNGGTMAVSIVPGSQDDIPVGQRQLQTNMLLVGSSLTGTRTIKITAKTTSAGMGAIIKTPAMGGTRVMRVRMTNTNAWALQRPNLTFSFTAAGPSWPTAVTAYVNSVGVNINVNGTFITTGAAPIVQNPILNDAPITFYDMTGGGSYCPGGAAVTVGLSGSQTGKNYQLLKDGIAYGAVKPGTGSPLSWSVTDAGIYTCVVGTTPMNLTAIVTPIPALPVSVTLVSDVTFACQGTPINFTATPVNGGTTPTYDWYVAGLLQPGNGPTLAYTGPANPAFSAYCILHSSEGCVSGNPAQSNDVTGLSIAPTLTPAVSIVADDNTVCEGTAVNFTATPTNGGLNPVYNWFVDGIMQSSHLPTLQWIGPSSFFDVFCEMVTSTACYTQPFVNSNTIAVSINPIPAPPVSGGDVVKCANQLPATLVDIVPPLMSVNWYDAAIGGNLLLAGSTTYNTSIAGTYYNSTIDPATGCESTTRTAVMLTVNQNPAPPVSGGDVIVCENLLPATLVDIVPMGMEVKWYDAAIGGNFLFAGANYVTSTPGTYYNETVDPITTCVSLTRTAVMLTVNPNPAPPVSGGDVIACANQLPATLVDIVPFGMEVKWYDAAVGGTFLANGANYITSIPGTYYNETVNPATNCVSLTRTAVMLTVNPTVTPMVSIMADQTAVCLGTTVNFTATPVDGGALPTYNWYVDGIMQMVHAPTFSFAPTVAANVYCELISDLNCAINPGISNTVSITINPFVTPMVSITESANPVVSGTSVTFTPTIQPGYTVATTSWYVNTVMVSNLPVYSYVPVNGDQVYATFTFNEACTNGAMSNTVTMTVTPSFFPITKFFGTGNWNDASKWDHGVPTIAQKAVIQGTCTATTDGVCDVLVIYPKASITINTGVTINVTTQTYAISDASGTGAIVQFGTLNAGPHSTYYRYITGGVGHLISSPLSALKSYQFTGAYLAAFSESTNAYLPNITNATTLLGVGKGYWLSNPATKTFVMQGGMFNKGDKFLSLPYSGPTKGNSLIGNPYPCRLNANILAWSKSNVANSIMVWDPTINNYLTWNGSTGTLPNGIIAETQGFFVKSIGPAASITIPELSQTAMYSNNFKNAINNQIRLDITGNNSADGMIVYFDQNATVGTDHQFDVEKEYGNIESPQLFSITSDNNLSINCLPEVNSSVSVPVGLKVGANTNYTITASDIESFNAGTQIYLEDLKSNKMINLTEQASYTFDANANDNVNRFILHFGTPSTLNSSSSINAYAFDNTIYVNNPSLVNINEVVVYNSLGQIVTSFKPEVTSNKGYNLNTAAGSYIVKIVTDNKVISNKVNLK